MVIGLKRSANDLHNMDQLMPLPPHYLVLYSSAERSYLFLVPAYQCCSAKEAA